MNKVMDYYYQLVILILIMIFGAVAGSGFLWIYSFFEPVTWSSVVGANVISAFSVIIASMFINAKYPWYHN